MVYYYRVTKIGKWSWRDAYRLYCAIMLAPLVARDYELRMRGIRPDRMHWADQLMLSMGYALVLRKPPNL